MEEAAKIAGMIVGSFIYAFIVTWIVSRPVRWIAHKAAPENRRIAMVCALISMLLVSLFVFKNPSDTEGIIRDAALVLAVALNFLFDLAWVKYPREKRVATPPASPES